MMEIVPVGRSAEPVYDRLEKEARYAQHTAIGGYGDSLLHTVKGKVDMAFELGAIDAEEFVKLNRMTVVFMNTSREFHDVQRKEWIDNARMTALPECKGCKRKAVKS